MSVKQRICYLTSVEFVIFPKSVRVKSRTHSRTGNISLFPSRHLCILLALWLFFCQFAPYWKLWEHFLSLALLSKDNDDFAFFILIFFSSYALEEFSLKTRRLFPILKRFLMFLRLKSCDGKRWRRPIESTIKMLREAYQTCAKIDSCQHSLHLSLEEDEVFRKLTLS